MSVSPKLEGGVPQGKLLHIFQLSCCLQSVAAGLSGLGSGVFLHDCPMLLLHLDR